MKSRFDHTDPALAAKRPRLPLQLNIRIAAELDERLRARADYDRKKVSTIVAEAVTAYLDQLDKTDPIARRDNV